MLKEKTNEIDIQNKSKYILKTKNVEIQLICDNGDFLNEEKTPIFKRENQDISAANKDECPEDSFRDIKRFPSFFTVTSNYAVFLLKNNFYEFILDLKTTCPSCSKEKFKSAKNLLITVDLHSKWKDVYGRLALYLKSFNPSNEIISGYLGYTVSDLKEIYDYFKSSVFYVNLEAVRLFNSIDGVADLKHYLRVE